MQTLKTWWKNLKARSTKQKLVKRVYIPKGSGEFRPLGLPALRDKILQKAVANILEAIYEQDFLNSSYGYRPKVGAQKAVKDLTKELMQKYSYVVEADIKSFFDNIYYGVMGNSKGLHEFYESSIKILYKWLNRRSQRRSFNWEEFNAKMKSEKLPVKFGPIAMQTIYPRRLRKNYP